MISTEDYFASDKMLKYILNQYFNFHELKDINPYIGMNQKQIAIHYTLLKNKTRLLRRFKDEQQASEVYKCEKG